MSGIGGAHPFGSPGVSRIEALPGRVVNPSSTTFASPPAPSNNPTGAAPATTTNFFGTTLTFSFPAGASGSTQSLTQSANCTTWTSPLTLTGQTAYANVQAHVAQASVLPLILGVPYVSLQFVSGSPIGQGISSFFLQSGQTYTGPSLTVGLTAYYSAALASTLIVQVAVTATLSVAATPNP